MYRLVKYIRDPNDQNTIIETEAILKLLIKLDYENEAIDYLY